MIGEEELAARVAARAAELGKTVAQVVREAKLAHDYFAKPPRRGRRLDALSRIARTLDWSLAELIGPSAAAQRRLARIAEVAALLYVAMRENGGDSDQTALAQRILDLARGPDGDNSGQ